MGGKSGSSSAPACLSWGMRSRSGWSGKLIRSVLAPHDRLAPQQYWIGRKAVHYAASQHRDKARHGTWRRCCTSSTTGSARRWSRGALFAQAANELYGHPDSPLSYLPGSRNVAAAFDLMTRLTQRYERPDFGIDDGALRRRASTRCARSYDAREALLPPAALREGGRARAAARARVRAALGPLRDAAARHRAHAARRPRRVDHRLDRREGNPDRGRPVPLRRLRGLRARVHRFTRAATAHAISVCQPTVPVLAARLAHGRRGRGDPAHAHDDGRARSTRAAAPPRSTRSPSTGRSRGSRRR